MNVMHICYAMIFGVPLLYALGILQPQEAETPAEEATTRGASVARYELPATTKGAMIINHKAYTLSYDRTHNTPRWVAWHLTAAHADGPVPRATKFLADPKVPTSCRVDYYEYKESGYDRGHMCPAGDNKWNIDAMRECFYMSNMCPQTHALNAGSWGTLESACRKWAVTEGSIYIVCGPIYKGTRHERIGVEHRIDVPEQFFKAVLSLRRGHEKAIAFVYRNDETKQPYRAVAMSVDEVERRTGLDLFTALDNQLEKRVEAKADIRQWK